MKAFVPKKALLTFIIIIFLALFYCFSNMGRKKATPEQIEKQQRIDKEFSDEIDNRQKFLTSLNLSDPAGEMKKHFSQGDKRCISVASQKCPGVNSDFDVNQYGVRDIPSGFGDSSVDIYAKKYNASLMEKIKQEQNDKSIK